MQIEINDKKIECQEEISLAEMLRQQSIPTEYVAVAVDFVVVPKEEWEGFILHDGNKIIIIKAVQGG